MKMGYSEYANWILYVKPPLDKLELTASLVTYKSKPEEIEALLRSLQQEPCLGVWIVVDNGGSADIRRLTEKFGGKYLDPGANVGFGAGHNLAVRALSPTASEYHLFVNPDISFAEGILSKMVEMMDARRDVGLMMPKVLSPDGSIQHLCKLLPKPADLMLRRFAPGAIKRMAQRRIAKYEMSGLDPDLPAYVPFLSGCFMFTRREVFEAVGGFDPGFFLYMEDVDLCRRLGQSAKLLYWPGVAVTHVHARGSHKSFGLMLVFVRSAIRYYNKWGWLWDPYSRRVNREALSQCAAQSTSISPQ